MACEVTSACANAGSAQLDDGGDVLSKTSIYTLMSTAAPLLRAPNWQQHSGLEQV